MISQTKTEAAEALAYKESRRLTFGLVSLRPNQLMTLWGFDAVDGNPSGSRDISTSASRGAAQSGAVAEADPLAAFLASLTHEQRAKLAALLGG